MFYADQIEYLDYYITCDKIKPLGKKVYAILDLEIPKHMRCKIYP